MNHKIIISIIVFATLTRVAIPPFFGHLPNFSALDALALFCGAYCERRMMAVALCLISVWVGDILLTHTLFYEGFYWQYGSYALITLLGATCWQKRGSKWFPRRQQQWRMALASVFVITNFGVWFSGSLYPLLESLIACYIAAVPFFDT